MIQDPPNSVQVELTEGCPLACWFCGIQSIRDNGASRAEKRHGHGSGPFRFMPVEVARRIADELARAGWSSRVEFAMHGEPSLHPQLLEIVAHFRKVLPQTSLLITTNGAGIASSPLSKILALWDAGINTIALDDYAHSPYMPKIRPLLPALQDVGEQVACYPQDKDANPHHRFSGRRVVVIHDIASNTTGNHLLTNEGGNSGGPCDEPLQQRCARPFRELAFRHDGRVAVCCDDWKGVFITGDIRKMSIETLWNSPAFDAARRKLYHSQRDFGPCRGCNIRTVRNGLLPDHKGQGTMPLPDASTENVLRAVEHLSTGIITGDDLL